MSARLWTGFDSEAYEPDFDRDGCTQGGPNYVAHCVALREVCIAAIKQRAKLEGTPDVMKGEIACTACGSKLEYRVSGVSHSIWAQCDTPDCIIINKDWP
jgi:hypothetical protein